MASPSASSPTNLPSLALLTLLAVAFLISDISHLPTTAKALRVVKKTGEDKRPRPPDVRRNGKMGPREGHGTENSPRLDSPPGTGNWPRLDSPPGTGNWPRLDSPPGASQYTVTSRNNDGSYSYVGYNTPNGGPYASETSNCAVVYQCPRQYDASGSSSEYTVTSTNYDGSYSYSNVGYNTYSGDQLPTDTSGCTVVSNCSP